MSHVTTQKLQLIKFHWEWILKTIFPVSFTLLNLSSQSWQLQFKCPVLLELWIMLYLAAFNFLSEILRSSAFVFRTKSHLLHINCLFSLMKKYLKKELSFEKGGGCLPNHGLLCSKYYYSKPSWKAIHTAKQFVLLIWLTTHTVPNRKHVQSYDPHICLISPSKTQ